MKRLAMLLALSLVACQPAYSNELPKGYCEVVVCNKIERFSLDPFSHFKDKLGETCFGTIIGQEDAVVDKVLTEESRWYQGQSINPTKKSVTRVKEVKSCNK